MHYGDFLSIIADIEKRMGDDGYWINVSTINGESIDGSWEWLNQNPGQVLKITSPEETISYIPLGMVTIIQHLKD